MPFFQGVSYDATFESVDIPPEVLAMRDERLKERGGGRLDDVEFTFTKGRWGHLGEATLVNRVKSHVDVGEKWYPDILQKIRTEQAAVVNAARRAEELNGPGLEAGGGYNNEVEAADSQHAIQAH